MVEINRSLHLLYPPVKEALERAMFVAQAQNLWAYPFEVWRSTERQSFLYAQGRSNPGRIITHARPGLSWHHYGVAVDMVFDADPFRKGIQWTWEGGYSDANGDNYDKLARIMKAEGFQWLGDTTNDRAHFQFTYGFSIQQAKQIADSLGVLGLWREFDRVLEKQLQGKIA